MNRDTSQSEVFTITNFVLGSSSQKDEVKSNEISIFGGIAICTCVKGSLHFFVNHKEYKLQKGQIFTILSRQIIQIIERSADFYGKILVFPIDFMPDYLSPINYEVIFRIIEKPVLSVSPKTMQTVLDLHNMIIHNHNDKDKAYKEDIVKMLLLTTVLEIGSEYAKNQQKRLPAVKTRKEEVTEEFIKRLFEDYKVGHTVAYYAEKMCMTPKYLSSVVKSVIGVGALNCINQIIIAKIKSFLRNSQLTVAQISEEFNFSNPSFFGKYFKEHTGVTPLQFRHHNQ